MICVLVLLEMTFKRNDAVKGYMDNIHLEFDCGKLSARKMLKMRSVVMDDDNIDTISGEGDYIHVRTCCHLLCFDGERRSIRIMKLSKGHEIFEN